MIEARNLSKKFKKKLAVDKISFDVEPGLVTGFLGPNGAGKSTTMRLMLGLDIGGGDTKYDGKHLIEYAQPSRMVGVLLEAKAFHPKRSARNHLRILAAAGGIPERRVDEVLGIVGLKEVAKKKPGKFSLGMSQRLGIAAAILGNPKYLLLDEPANGLDPEGIAWLRQFLKDYAKAGNAVLVSSHLLSEMALIAENIVVIGKGKLIANTSVKSLKSSNRHSGVFIRSKNLVALKKVLATNKFAFHAQGEGLLVANATSDEIGGLAFKEGIAILELTNQSASLEDIFLELTEDEQEFKTSNKVNKK